MNVFGGRDASPWRTRTLRAAARADWRLRCSPVGPDARGAVLMYHSVGGWAGNTGGRTVDVDRFRAHLRRFASLGQFVDLPAVVEGDASGPLRVAVTFDDGYETVYTDALPVLREFDAPATVFVIADRVGGETEHGVPYLDADQVRELVADDLVTVGNHTRTHARLPDLDADALREEVVGAKRALRERFGCAADRFCYPYGAYGDRELELVSETHALGTADAGLVGDDPDQRCVPRVDMSDPASILRCDLAGLASRVGVRP
ncbi:MAG: polysaccharide deacetylase family protein [Halobacteriaceae archaeon]